MDTDGRGGSSQATGAARRRNGKGLEEKGGGRRPKVPSEQRGGARVPRDASADARRVALAIAAVGLDKKASAIEIIDVSGKVDYADLLVLMSGRSDRHVHAIARGVEQGLRTELGVAPIAVEGMQAARWVLLDFNEVVVHVFQEDARCFYDLEGLWIDAQRVTPEAPAEDVRH